MPEERQSVFDIFMNANPATVRSMFEDKEVYASTPNPAANFYDRAVEEFWRDPIGGKNFEINLKEPPVSTGGSCFIRVR